MEKKLRILITGGTFDKKYDPLKGTLSFADTHLPEIMEQVRCTIPYTLEVALLMDSLDMDADDRHAILAACSRAPESALVLTHGTDTMALTAELLGRANLGKTIVLTGAMVPYSVQGSDALFNLGAAVMASTLLPEGVFIAMNGRVHSWDNVRKNKALGVFEALTQEP